MGIDGSMSGRGGESRLEAAGWLALLLLLLLLGTPPARSADPALVGCVVWSMQRVCWLRISKRGMGMGMGGCGWA